MKKILIAILVCVLLLCSSIFGNVLFLKYYFNKKQATQNKQEAEKILTLATELLVNDSGTENNSENQEVDLDQKSEQSNIVLENDIIGILKIPRLSIEAPIKDGTSQEIMRTSIGHFVESDYWNGNVSLASHNGGTNAHYFEKINQLNADDEIEYISKYGTRKYKVKSIQKIESTDWSLVQKNDGKENTITLITCINGKPKLRLCVRGVEI